MLYACNYDIILITETWLCNEITNGLLDPSMHYKVIRKDRAHSKGGGVCAFVNKRWHVISTSIDAKFDDCEVVCFDCLGSSNHVRVRCFVVYRPPLYDHVAAHNMRCIIDCLASYMNPRNTNIIVGDFNLPKINWKTLSCPSDNFHKPFLSFLLSPAAPS